MEKKRILLKLKNQLKSEISKEKSDTNLILMLSNQIAKLDEGTVRFTVDAGVIDRLGKELVSKAETAVSELVKNGYDADARNVKLIFENSDEPNGTLTIEDDGLGMTKEQLIDGFMRVSSTEKIHFPASSRYSRNRAGRKGVGRFATQRLGQKLTIISQTLKSKKALRLEIDWNVFKSDIDLFSIPIYISEVKKQKDEGTTLIIDQLRDGWSESSLKKAYRYVSELIQPYPLSKENKANISKKEISDPGFKAVIFKKINGKLTPIADEDVMFNNYALAAIEGYIDSKGIGRCKISSDILNIQDSYTVKKEIEVINEKGKKNKSEVPYNNLTNIHFKCLYFHRSYFPKQESINIRKILETNGGIKLYRNGFRVPSIGEPKDDWLGLDVSVRRRSILDPHGNNSFIGFVEVTDRLGEIFDETSNRESLLENTEFEDLKDFLYRALLKSVLFIGESRGTKGKTNRKNYKSPTERLEDTISSLEKLALEFRQKGDKSVSSSIALVSNEIRRAIELQKEIDVDLLNEVSMLRVLSSLGLTIGEFTHEIKNYIRSLKDDADFFAEKKSKGLDKIVGMRLVENISSFNSYASYFDETISQNSSRLLQPLSLEIELEKFCSLIKPALKRSDITMMEPEFEEYGLYTCPMHPSEFRSILFNFFTNSRKAILKSENQGKLLVKVSGVGKYVFLDFADNGIGISENIKDRIFDAFFTTSVPVGHSYSEPDELTGSGLGLKIVKDIITSYGGKVLLSTAPRSYKTCFRLEIPMATTQQLEEYGIEY